MRLLGNKSSLSVFRKDLLHLEASLEADDNADVVALGPEVASCLDELYQERDAFETVENTVVIARAVRKKRDKGVDVTLVDLGSRSRVKNKKLNERLFPSLSPSDTGSLPLDKQMVENERILLELKGLEAGHPIRVEYETVLENGIEKVKGAIAGANDAEVNLKMGRAKLRTFKTKADRLRLDVHAKLVLITGDKKVADSYFRPASEPDEGESDEGEGHG